MKRSTISLQGMIRFTMLRLSPFLLLFALASATSVSLRRKTTLSSLVRDIDHLHQTGKSALSADGSKLYLTLGRQVSGSEAGLSPQHEAKHLKVKPPQDDFSEC
ncbi:hypothetical protein LOK49_LG05G01298 [Camellia lanceoleosa]|uniref:Uncharacterized protein n=1 Tax=Camellia lanceoleosa TaxID=1840588 RepID=A0ACC0HQX0_9ERIC|nr:hypothetical protein LOK49_LG05G01298 [Camellia lanceoleosa]